MDYELGILLSAISQKLDILIEMGNYDMGRKYPELKKREGNVPRGN